MLKEVLEVKAGYEDIHARLVEKKDNIEAEIRKQVEAETAVIDEIMAKLVVVKTVEVPDEEEVVEHVEEQPMY